MSGAKALIESLKAEKVKHIFGIPGGAMIPVYDALYDEKKIRHILVRHEQAAAHAADGYARVSGGPGVCMATSGPGATNLTTGILNAYIDSSPVIAITGQVPKSLLGTDAFQEADVVSVMLPITKHNFMMKSVSEVPRRVRLAFKIATTGRPGPVHIDLPKDVQVSEDKVEIPARVRYSKKIKTKPKAEELRQVLKLLTRADRPLIFAGGGIVSGNASAELVRFAELLQAPVVTTPLGKGTIPENHPLALGMLGMHGRLVANIAVTECDLIMGLGVRFDDRATGDVQHFAPKAKKIHVDIDPVELGKNVRVDLPIAADVKTTLKALI
ncbi:MAG: thiamine pyrophosphate-binding protein, partial [Candidatus Hadarchaeota archaeon]|nr:thiamine pyrophosphate-binding protein [Candidatus Hadarchaeota archaeon]